MLAFYLQSTAAIAAVWPWFWPLVGGVFGAVMGSFLECASYRIPRGISLRHPPSMCPSCQTTLKAPDLVPVASYLASGGRCRHCKAPIRRAALWLEIASTATGALLVYLLQTYLQS